MGRPAFLPGAAPAEGRNYDSLRSRGTTRQITRDDGSVVARKTLTRVRRTGGSPYTRLVLVREASI